MIKKRNFAVGFLVASATIVLFTTVFEDAPKKIIRAEKYCELSIEDYVFLPNGDEILLEEFDPQQWEIDVTNEGVIEIIENRIRAIGKGEAQIIFKKGENCILEKKIAVANINSDSKSEKLKEELAINLKNTQVDDSIILLPPSEVVSQ